MMAAISTMTTIVLCILKLAGWLPLDWVWVLSPTWIYLIGIICLIAYYLAKDWLLEWRCRRSEHENQH